MQTELELADVQIRPRHGPTNGNARAVEQTIGRADDLRRVQEYADRRQDALVLGPAGVGKSHLLARVRGPRIVRVRSLGPARQTLLEIAEALFQAGVLRMPPAAVGSATPRAIQPPGPSPRLASTSPPSSSSTPAQPSTAGRAW